jgi:uncharacterized membrane protein
MESAGKGRAEAFSDGVLAIVLTLLVLDLRPPRHEAGRLFSGLARQWPTYLAYVASYLYVAVVWLNHKAAFDRLRRLDRRLHWANIGVLFTTALLPFATSVLAEALQEGNRADAGTSVALYAAVGALLCVSWLGFFHAISLSPDLIAEGVGPSFFGRERLRALAGLALYLLAGILGWAFSPQAALAVFLALPLFYGLTSEGFPPPTTD